jgi:hypothetical protein
MCHRKLKRRVQSREVTEATCHQKPVTHTIFTHTLHMLKAMITVLVKRSVFKKRDFCLQTDRDIAATPAIYFFYCILET